MNHEAANDREIGPSVGHQIPEFQLQDEEGTIHHARDLRGSSGLLLIFVHGTWCASCVSTFYMLSKHTPIYHRHGINVAVLSADDPPALRNFKISAPKPINYTLLADADQGVHQQYNVGHAGLWLLADSSGVVRAKFVDETAHHPPPHSEILNAIQADLQG